MAIDINLTHVDVGTYKKKKYMAERIVATEEKNESGSESRNEELEGTELNQRWVKVF